MRLTICFVFLIAGWALNVDAAIIFDFGGVTAVTPGEQGKIPVYVRGTDNEPLEAYDLPIDVGGDGLGFPGGISFFGTDIANDDFAEEVDTFSDVIISGTDPLPPVPPFDPQFDAIFSDDGPTIALSPTPLHLFNILLDIPQDFAGSLTITIATSGYPVPLSVTSGSQQFTDPAAGVLEIQPGTLVSVPEPGSLAILGLLVVALPIRLRPRRSAGC